MDLVETSYRHKTAHIKITIPVLLILLMFQSYAQEKKVKLGVIGLTHSHVHWILSRQDMGDIDLVGVVEPNKELAQRYAQQYNFNIDMVFDTMDTMISQTRPEAVAAFGTIYDHLNIVETCAPKGIHVMVEKPLAVSLEHAKKMASLAKKHNIHLLTNYETSWYPTNERAKKLLTEGVIGDLRKVIVRDGHKGPKKIGVNPEFLEWLTDPVLNGGGAIMDFGCYGANLMTWILNGERPKTVTAVTQQLQPENNPKVDDDATIILTYESSMAILEPSWNWPIGRKDMEIYGEKGAIYAEDKNNLTLRISEGYSNYTEERMKFSEREKPFDDPFSVFASVVNGSLILDSFDPYSLENNMITMQILQAAIDSATKKKTIEITD
ncbi:Gfo/Idh/MocA family protein [Maribacter sp. 2304DJ31-5]|uniref:Gfo/Idh/MocA family protein n=1 Tax=Maribacter sp. 2304DJ31-5 TaxID=3386273 RepID=UPI0039BCCBC7